MKFKIVKIINKTLIKSICFFFIAEFEVIELSNKNVLLRQHTLTIPTIKSEQKIDSNMMALHTGSRVYVQKEDIMKIYCVKPALYSIRLAELVFGFKTMTISCMPDDDNPNFTPLDDECLDSIISNIIIIIFDQIFTNQLSISLLAHVMQVFKHQNKNITRAAIKGFIRARLNKLHSVNN